MMIDIIINVVAWSLVGATIYWNVRDVKVKDKLLESNKEIGILIKDNTEWQQRRTEATNELIDIINEVARDNE